MDSKIDIVIVSYAKDDYCKSLTSRCIETLFSSEENSSEIFNVIVVESQEGVTWNYKNCNIQTLSAPLPYGYHKFLNFGRKSGSSEWVALCNNDLEFTKNWFSTILDCHEKNPDVISFSPICPMTQVMYGIYPHSGIRFGHNIRKELSGWCIVHKREIYDIKVKTTSTELCEGIPYLFKKLLDYSYSLNFEDKPDYSYMTRQCKNYLKLYI